MAIVDLSTEKKIMVFVDEIALDASILEAIRNLCDKRYEERARPICFDLGRVKYIDSEAVGGLLALEKDMKLVRGSLEIDGITLELLQILTRMHLAEYFNILHGHGAGPLDVKSPEAKKPFP